MSAQTPDGNSAAELQRDKPSVEPTTQERKAFCADWIASTLATAQQQSISRQQAQFLNEIFDEATAGHGCELLALLYHDERAYVERINDLIVAYLLPYAECACDEHDWAEQRREEKEEKTES